MSAHEPYEYQVERPDSPESRDLPRWIEDLGLEEMLERTLERYYRMTSVYLHEVPEDYGGTAGNDRPYSSTGDPIR
ncbi:MAG: hypothetical protein SVS85_03220 [Candidatus Nanohaloarchaea archaeon]|nr:hypothetical protein [Candidatus Nanohaloarchaea archaeon]